MEATMAGPVLEQSVHALIGCLDAAVRLESVDAITECVKRELGRLIAERSLLLPERCLRPQAERYARHLLHRSEELGYTAVVMVWGPGQRTGLHDHSGLWCVEGVVEGELEITRFERLGESGAFRFEECERIHASAGSSGSLIPPHEYHVLANDSAEQAAITLHIYGGEMTTCSVFEPQADGTFVRRERHLSYDD
ncbi:MAG TPA: cysteine dioxygenase family protein [Thermoanaerobaculia bacterium]|jgi:predicted metal-dependent enzyme (double-stranded beta helix superfamily)|nr:cysteine dioxygenase family protein [Thermoanaerobaculia bacterium]